MLLNDESVYNDVYGYGYDYGYGYRGDYNYGYRYGYGASGAYSYTSGRTTTKTKKELPREAVKMLAEQIGCIYKTKEEAIENANNKDKAYFPGNDGWYCIFKYIINDNIYKVCRKISDNPLLDKVEPGIIDINITKKIPKEIFDEIIGNFSYVNTKYGSECAAQIYCDPDGKFFIYYPVQTATGAHVSYDKDPKPIELRKAGNTLHMELHSHDSMGAFWSGEDNSNERETGLYMVIGTFNAESATYKVRIKSGDVYENIPATMVFDITEEEEKESLLKVNHKAVNPEDTILKVLTVNKYEYAGYAGRYVTNKKGEEKEKEIKESTPNIVPKAPDKWKMFVSSFADMWCTDNIITGGTRNKIGKESLQYLRGGYSNKVVSPSSSCLSEKDIVEIGTSSDTVEVLNSTAKACTKALSNLSSCLRNSYTSESQEDFENDLYKSYDVISGSSVFDISIFWELLSYNEKSRLITVFKESTIPELAKSFYACENVNYMTVLLLYKIIIAPSEVVTRIKEAIYEAFPDGVSLSDLNEAMCELEEDE